MGAAGDHTLEFLLAFDQRTHWYEGGYYVKFEIKRVRMTGKRPHGLKYSFTLHDPDGKRLLGYDNAHQVAAKGSRFRERPEAADHWHRMANDPGVPYHFTDAATLLEDFYGEVERVLRERGIPVTATETREGTQED